MIALKTINSLAEEVEKWAIGLRRQLHRWPELGNEEFNTNAKIKYELNELGIETEQLLKTGIVGTLKGGKPGKVIALRSELDALQIEEEIPLDFASERKGYMHACGHDVHMAVLLGTARVLSEIREELSGIVKFIFQPAEETTGGAARMIKRGCLENPKVDYILGLHVKPELPAGTVGIKYGKVHASSDMFKITIAGAKSHGASPNQGVDAIYVAAQIITSLQGIVSRNINPLKSAVISIGTIEGGNSRNVIADEVILEGTIRSLDRGNREFLKERIRSIVRLVSMANMARGKVEFEKGYSQLINDNLIVDVIKDAAVYGNNVEKIIELKEPTMGVDDFSFFLEKVPGAFFFLGSGFKDRENPGLHTGNFEIDERCIKTGILAETLTILKLMEG